MLRKNKIMGALAKWLWEEAHILKVEGLNPSAVY